MMSDVKIKELINSINNPELRSKLLLLYELTQKYEEIESLSVKIEKLEKQLKKLERILKSKKYETMSDEEKEKVNKNINKILDYLSQIINQLKDISAPSGIDSEMDKMNAETVKDMVSQLNDIFNKTNSMLPEKVKQELASQLNQMNQMLQNMVNTPGQQSFNGSQTQGTQSNGSISEKLNQLMDKINDLVKEVSNNNVGPSVKYSANKVKSLMNKIMNDFGKNNNVNINDLNNLSKNLDAIKNSFVPSSIRDKVKDAQNHIEYFKNTITQQELYDNLNNILNNSTDKVKSALSKFMSNTSKTNLQDLIKSINNSDLPQEAKDNLINQVKQLAENLSKIRRDFKKSAIRNLSQAHSKLTKMEKEGVPEELKNELKNIKQLLNQNMFFPSMKDLQKLKNMMNNIKDNISNSNLPNRDKLMNNINDAVDNIENAVKNLEQSNNPIKQFNQFIQDSLTGKQKNQTGQGQKMNISQPPFPGMSSGQQSGQQGQMGSSQQSPSGQSGMSSQQSGSPPASYSSGLPNNFGSMLNNIMDSLQNAVSQAESSLDNELSKLKEMVKQYAQSQGSGNGTQSQGSDVQSFDYNNMMQSLNSIANKIKSGSYSPQDLANAINSLNNMMNSNGFPDSLKPMVQGVMNGLKNLMSLQLMMNNISPINQSLSNAVNSVQSVMNSLNSLLNSSQSMAGGSGNQTMMGDAPAGAGGYQGGTSVNGSNNNSFNDVPSSMFNNNLINMLNNLSNSNLTESQRRRLTDVIKKLMKNAIKEANELNSSANSILSNNNAKLAQLKALRDSIKNNLHNLKIDDELLNMAQQFDDALGDSSSGGGLAGGMFASQLHEIEQVDLNEALNQLVKMNSEWIRRYKDLFDRLISEIIELKSKEIGYLLNPHGRFIDYNATINKTVKNAGIIQIVKKDVDQAIGDFLFILDASGSMHDIVELKSAPWVKTKEVKNRLYNRLKQYQVGLITAYVMGEAIRRVGEGDYYIIVFADRMVDLSNAPLDTILFLIQNPEELNKYIGGGTNLAPVILKIINSYMTNDMNIVLFTDTGDVSVWNTFILEKLKENSKKVAVFCAGNFFQDTAEAFKKAGIPVFSFSDFDDLFELMKQYYIADLSPEQAVLEAKEYLKSKKSNSITGLIPEKV